MTRALMVIDVPRVYCIDGREAQERHEAVGRITDMQLIPNDPRPAVLLGGLSIGTPAVTAWGMGESEMGVISRLLYFAIGVTDGRHVFDLVKTIAQKFRS